MWDVGDTRAEGVPRRSAPSPGSPPVPSRTVERTGRDGRASGARGKTQGISGRHDGCSPGGRAATTRHKENRHEAHHPSRPPGPRTGKHGAEPALAPAPTDLAALAADAERASAALHPELSVALELDGVPEVRADAARLRRVLANLLANASEAGARRVRIRGAADGPAVRIVVEDDGPGVDPALRARLFEPFATGRAGGTGLGLAVSRRIVERHGGTLALASVTGTGAAFEITLPRAVREG